MKFQNTGDKEKNPKGFRRWENRRRGFIQKFIIKMLSEVLAETIKA